VDTAAAKENQTKLEGKTFVLKAKGGESGKLFGAITGKEIAALIEKESGIAVDKKKLVVDTIKNFGTYAVTVKLYTGIAAKINVSVEKE
ncbi:MAG: 50S ribosomal protein L9, partial [Clostridia bacterium]|nr:50S ribosomal protein L9 [Clostridia bacterium]